MTKNINGRGLVFVQVPEGATEFRKDKYCGGIAYFKGGWNGVDVPNIGNYSIIGLASSLSEEQWAGIVESCVIIGFDFFYNGFVDYTKTQAGYFKTTESGLSLLSSLGMNPKTTLILIKEK